MLRVADSISSTLSLSVTEPTFPRLNHPIILRTATAAPHRNHKSRALGLRLARALKGKAEVGTHMSHRGSFRLVASPQSRRRCGHGDA